MILSIETSIKDGSLALLRGVEVIDEWCGNREVSRSVDLIVQIGEMLKRNGVSKTAIEKILVSKGPGSFTGLRVGIATAKGLSLALKCAVGGISILRAMAEVYQERQRVICLVSAGRGLFFWQSFDFVNDGTGKNPMTSEIVTGNAERLFAATSVGNFSRIIVQSEAFDDLNGTDQGKHLLQKNEYVVPEGNLAKLIGRLNESNPPLFDLNIEPLYIRPAVVSGK